jgi:hypothetical protein
MTRCAQALQAAIARGAATSVSPKPTNWSSSTGGELGPWTAQRFQIWAFIEAANAICLMRRRHPHRHVSRLYERIARRKGHPTAIGAVARHLAEVTYWLLSKQEPYREPRSAAVSSNGG